MTDNKLNLPLRYKRQISDLLNKYLPAGVEVWAYGSRVNGRGHSASDLDLVLRSSDLSKIDPLKICDLRTALTESNIPFLVEARDWASLPKSFHQEIERHYVVFLKAEKKVSKKF